MAAGTLLGNNAEHAQTLLNPSIAAWRVDRSRGVHGESKLDSFCQDFSLMTMTLHDSARQDPCFRRRFPSRCTQHTVHSRHVADYGCKPMALAAKL